ncbi:MAG: futalosine hydrolase [Mycobacteriales bacterium]
MTRIAVVTAVPRERDAVAAGVGVCERRRAGPYETIGGVVRGDAELVVLAAGVGPAAAAAAAMAIALGGVDVLFSAGVAGGFAHRSDVGDLVVATAVVAADLGANSPDGFLDLSALGFGAATYAVDEAASAHTAERLAAQGVAARRGAVLTVSAATGTDERALELASRHDAAAEAMEGAGVAHVASLLGIPLVELRAISNVVGRRDLDAWEVPRALAALEHAMHILFARG